MSVPKTDETRAILAEPKTYDNLNTLVEYTKIYGFDVMQGFIQFNDKHWSAEDFEHCKVGNYEGWVELFLEHVLKGESDINGVDLWEVLDEKQVAEKLQDGMLNDYRYMGVATGFCQGIFFRKRDK